MFVRHASRRHHHLKRQSKEMLEIIGKDWRGYLWQLPLIFMPLVINVKSEAFLNTSDPVKWACLCILGVLISPSIFASAAHANDGTKKSSIMPAALFALFFIGLSIGVTYTINPGEGLNRLAIWAASGAAFVATIYAIRSQENYSRHLQWALTLSALILCAQFLYALAVKFPDPTYDRNRQFSLIGHFNNTADALMVMMPLLTWTTVSPQGRLLRILAGLCLACTTFMLLASGSLGGMIGLTAAAGLTAVIWIIHWNRQRKLNTYRIKTRGLLYAGLTTMVLFAALRFTVLKLPEEVRKHMFERGEWWGAPTSIDAAKPLSLPPLAPLWLAITPALGSRAPMWAATAGMIAEHPWRGFGTGSYEYEYRNFGKRYDVFKDPETMGINAKTNPHNVFLQIASENGLPMALLFTGLYVWFIIKVMQQTLTQGGAFWLCGLWAVLATGLDAQVNHSFLNPVSLLVIAIAFGTMYGSLPLTGQHPLECRNPLGPLFVPLLVTGLSLVLASFPLRWAISEYYASKAFNLTAKHPKTLLREVKYDWETARDWFPWNVFALYGLANACFAQQNFKCTETHLKEVLVLSPYHTPALNLLAHIQVRTGRIDQATTTLNEVLRIDPDSMTVKKNLETVIKLKEPSPAQDSTRSIKTPGE